MIVIPKMIPIRHRGISLIAVSALITLALLYSIVEHTSATSRLSLIINSSLTDISLQVGTPETPEQKPAPPHPKYKPKSTKPSKPIIDNFPRALEAHSKDDLPSIPAWNRPPAQHVKEATPLFIGFTRNWRLIQQAVVSYITAGWPPEDIYVVENTGTMDANANGRLSLQNPFFLNHTRLHMLGVNVLTTPTLFTFAQLQNFYLWTAIQNKYPAYFWSHMDVVALSYEDRETDKSDTEFKSLYNLAVEALRESLDPNYAIDPDTGLEGRWALRFFAYDRLALVNTKAYEEVGGWDTHIPFYMTDCDMHERLFMQGFKIEDAMAGLVYDVGTSLDDLEVLYRKTGKEASFVDPHAPDPEAHDAYKDGSLKVARTTTDLGEPSDSASQSAVADTSDKRDSPSFHHLMDVCDAMQRSKNEADEGRNFWQARQTGGEGEPYYRDPEGFEHAIQMTIQFGRNVYSEKWGHRDCDLRRVGLVPSDAWRVEHDWD